MLILRIDTKSEEYSHHPQYTHHASFPDTD